jgi:hypothetical protein
MVPYRKHTYGPPRPVSGDGFTFLYVDDVCTSQERHVCVSIACYRDGFTFLYVDDGTLQETHLWASTACYWDTFTFALIPQPETCAVYRQDVPLVTCRPPPSELLNGYTIAIHECHYYMAARFPDPALKCTWPSSLLHDSPRPFTWGVNPLSARTCSSCRTEMIDSWSLNISDYGECSNSHD